MFQFRKKEVHTSTSEGLKVEAGKFQAAVADINANFTPAQINLAVIESAATKAEIDPALIAPAFEVYLKKNAVDEIMKIKAAGEYSFLTLEEVAASYGFDLDALGVSYYTE